LASSFAQSTAHRLRLVKLTPYPIYWVWDTVAAVGISPPAWRILTAVFGLAANALSMVLSWLMVAEINLIFVLYALLALIAFGAVRVVANILLRLKFVTGLPGFPWYSTTHLTSVKIEFLTAL
jgi:hypothetical protein